MAFQAILFDMDGLLGDTETLNNQAWQRAGASLGYAIPAPLIDSTIGRNTADTQQILQSAMGVDFPIEAVWDAKRQWVFDEMRTHGIPKMPWAEEALHSARKAGLFIALASSTRREWVEERLLSLQWDTLFQAIACGDEVEESKPNPAIFLLAASRLGILPENCLVMEDSPAGLEAAHRAGIPCLWVPDRIGPQERPDCTKLAEGVFSNLQEAMGWTLSRL